MRIRKTKVVSMMLLIGAIIIITVACGTNDNDSSQPYDTESEVSLVVIPDMRGYSLEAVTLEFSRLGFTPSLVKLISEEPVDTVLFIERMGQLTEAPTTIEVLISGGVPHFEVETTPESEQPQSQRQTFERMEFGGVVWLVLDEYDNKVLLLSERSLFDQAYNTELMPVTWETSSIRRYLNNDFFYRFSSEDRGRIAETRVINEDVLSSLGFSLYGLSSWPVPGGNDTDDRIFLLSADEIRLYFADYPARVVRRLADDEWLPGEDWVWMLRTPGVDNFQVLAVVPTGADNGYPITWNFGVRPALWLYLEP